MMDIAEMYYEIFLPLIMAAAVCSALYLFLTYAQLFLRRTTWRQLLMATGVIVVESVFLAICACYGLKIALCMFFANLICANAIEQITEIQGGVENK